MAIINTWKKLQIKNGIYTPKLGIWLIRESYGVLQDHYLDSNNGGS